VSDSRRERSGWARPRPPAEADRDRIVYGVRPVEELVRARPREVSVVYVAEGTRSPEIEGVVQTAKERGVTVEIRPRQMVAELAGAGVHQGLVAVTGRFQYATVDDLLAVAARANEPPLLVLLDGITDPHNLGAIARSAEVLGAHGLVLPERGSASVTPGAVKASAGATERVPIAEVGNLLRAIDALRDKGVRVLGAGAGEGARIDQVDLKGPLALVVGAEGRGMREAVARRCDGQFHIPQRGTVASLNASVAAAIALYEAARQRGW
jgi:23S rRNA (guanosine2251-2'-O)-methyltransferase